MKIALSFVLLCAPQFIAAMDDNPKTSDKYEEFRIAIMENRTTDVKRMIKPNINPTVCLGQQGKTCLDLAVSENQMEVAELLVHQMDKIRDAVNQTFYSAFQHAADEDKMDNIVRLMCLKEMPHDIKQGGCQMALGIACRKKYLPMVVLLVGSYPKYIKHPCFNFGFQFVGIHRYDECTTLVETVLRHPEAETDLSNMINGAYAPFELTYPNKIDEYRKLLQRAQELKPQKK